MRSLAVNGRGALIIILQELAASSSSFSLSLSFVSRLYMAYVIIRHYAIGQRREIALVRGGTHRVKS